MRHTVSRVVMISLVVGITGFLLGLQCREVGYAADSEYTIDDMKSTFDAMNVILDEAIAEAERTPPDCSKLRAYGAELKELTTQVEWLLPSLFGKPFTDWVDAFSKLDWEMGDRPWGIRGLWGTWTESPSEALEKIKRIKELAQESLDGITPSAAYEPFAELLKHLNRFIEWLGNYQDADELPQDFSWTYNSHWLAMSVWKHQVLNSFPAIYYVPFSEWCTAIHVFRDCMTLIEWLSKLPDEFCAQNAGAWVDQLKLIRNEKERMEILLIVMSKPDPRRR